MLTAGRIRRVLRLRSTILLACAAAVTPAFADFNEIIPDLSVGLRYDSNVRNAIDNSNAESALPLTIGGSLPYAWAGKNTSFNLSPRALFVLYAKDENQDLDQNNYFVDGRWNYATQRMTTGIAGGWNSISLRSNLFELEDGTEVDNDGDRIIWRASPYWSYQTTRRSSVQLNASYADVRFDEEFGTSARADYTTLNASGGLSYTINQKSSGTIRATYSKFDAENTTDVLANDSETTGMSGVYSYQFDPELSTSIDLGYARTRSTVDISICGTLIPPPLPPFCFQTIETDSTNFVGNLQLIKKGETLNYEISAGQTLAPNSQGVELLTRSVRGGIDKKFGLKWNGFASVVVSEQKIVNRDDNTSDRDFARVTIGATRKLKKRWSITVSYLFNYNRNRTRVIAEDYEDWIKHQANFQFKWQGIGWRW